jgi:hypothetical protein
MREICTCGSEGGAAQANAPSLPLCPGRFSETADWDLGSVRWNTRTFRFVNLLGMGRRLLSLTCIQPDSSERAIPARAGMFFRNVRAGFQSAITIIPLPVAYP